MIDVQSNFFQSDYYNVPRRVYLQIFDLQIMLYIQSVRYMLYYRNMKYNPPKNELSEMRERERERERERALS